MSEDIVLKINHVYPAIWKLHFCTKLYNILEVKPRSFRNEQGVSLALPIK